MLTKNIRLEKQRSRKQGAPSLCSGQTDTDIMLASSSIGQSMTNPANRHQKSCNVSRWPRTSLWAVVPRGARYRVGHTQTGTLMGTSNTEHQQLGGCICQIGWAEFRLSANWRYIAEDAQCCGDSNIHKPRSNLAKLWKNLTPRLSATT